MEVFRKYKLVWIIFLLVSLITSVGVTLIIRAVMNGDIVSNSFVQTGAIEYKFGTKWEKSFSYFKGHENRKIKLDAGEDITIKYSSEITKGSLDILFVNDKLEKIESLPLNTEGSYTFKSKEGGTYYLRIEGDSAKGKLDLTWSIK